MYRSVLVAKQHLKVDGGGISNRQREIPGFLPERGFLNRIIYKNRKKS